MRSNPILYVKSEKISLTQYTEGVSGHPCSGANRATQTERIYKPEDQEAMKLLEEAKVAYRLVDLSDCPFSTQLKAKITAINETPTLILNGRKIKGARNIRGEIENQLNAI